MSEENIYTFENPEYRKTYWHTCSHVLAQAMKRLHPEVKLAIGPAIDNGFYYDFDTPRPFAPEDLEALEAEMRKICKEKIKLERFGMSGVSYESDHLGKCTLLLQVGYPSRCSRHRIGSRFLRPLHPR